MALHDAPPMRRWMQSAKQYSYYAVFDGHAGVDAATYAAAHLHHNLVSSQAFRDGDIVDALKIAFNVTDADFLERSALTNLKSGCTAICCLKQGGERLFFAWAGDSQAILVRDGRPMDLTPPHKPDLEQERQRIEEMGGKVIQMDTWRVDGTLAVSRAIGDPDHKPYVTADPEVEVVDLEKGDDFIVIACDGLWDQVTPEEVTQIVYEHLEQSDATDPEEAAEKVAAKLSDFAKKEGSTDNITTIVVFLKDIQSIVSTGKSEYFTMELSNQSNNSTSVDFGGSLSHSFETNGRMDDDMTAEEELFSLTHNQLNDLEADGVTTTSCADPAAGRLIAAEAAFSSESTTAAANGYPDDMMSHDDEGTNLMEQSGGTPAIHLTHDNNMNKREDGTAGVGDGIGHEEDWADGGSGGKEGGVSGGEAVLLPTRATFATDQQQQETAVVASVTKELEELVDQAADSDSDDESDTDSVQYLVWQTTTTTPVTTATASSEQQETADGEQATAFSPTADPSSGPASPHLVAPPHHLYGSQDLDLDMDSRPESPVKSSSRPHSPTKTVQFADAATSGRTSGASGSRSQSPVKSGAGSPVRSPSPVKLNTSRSSSPSKSMITETVTMEQRAGTPIRVTRIVDIDNLMDTSEEIPIPVTMTTRKSPSPTGRRSPTKSIVQTSSSSVWQNGEESVHEEYYEEETVIEETTTTSEMPNAESSPPFKMTSFADFGFDENSSHAAAGDDVHEERSSFFESTSDHVTRETEERTSKEEAGLFNMPSPPSSASAAGVHQQEESLFGKVNGHNEEPLFKTHEEERKDVIKNEVNGSDHFFSQHSPSSPHPAAAQNLFSSDVSGKTGSGVADFVETVTESTSVFLRQAEGTPIRIRTSDLIGPDLHTEIQMSDEMTKQKAVAGKQEDLTRIRGKESGVCGGEAVPLPTPQSKTAATTASKRVVSSAPPAKPLAPRVSAARLPAGKPATSATLKSATGATSTMTSKAPTSTRTTSRPTTTARTTTTSTSRPVSSSVPPKTAVSRVTTSRLTTTAKPATNGALKSTAGLSSQVASKTSTTALKTSATSTTRSASASAPTKPLASKVSASRLTTAKSTSATSKPAGSTSLTAAKTTASVRSALSAARPPTSATSKSTTSSTTNPVVSKVTTARPTTTTTAKSASSTTLKPVPPVTSKAMAPRVTAPRATTTTTKPAVNGASKTVTSVKPAASSLSASRAAPSSRTALMTLKKTTTTSPSVPNKLKTSSGSTEPKAVKKLAKTESATVTTKECISVPESIASAETAANADLPVATTNGDLPSNQSVQF